MFWHLLLSIAKQKENRPGHDISIQGMSTLCIILHFKAALSGSRKVVYVIP